MILLPTLIFWKGWGLSVMLVTVLWFFAVFGTLVAIDGIYPDSLYTPDKAKAVAYAWRLVALTFSLSAASILLVSRHRIRKIARAAGTMTREAPAVSQPDEFMFIPLKYWPYILAACSLGALVRSLITLGSK